MQLESILLVMGFHKVSNSTDYFILETPGHTTKVQTGEEDIWLARMDGYELAWSVSFSPSTPVPVIVAAVIAALS